MLDFIIIGQGVAGSFLAAELLQRGCKILVIDKLNFSSASNIAYAVINPITGRRMVKTWLADELIPCAEKTYRQLEKNFSEQFFAPVKIVRLFSSVKEQNDWSARCADADYEKYLSNSAVVHFDSGKIKNDFGGFEINGGYKIAAAMFFASLRRFFKEKNVLLEEEFQFENLVHETDGVRYKNHTARKIIFCDGAHALQNPYFKFLPFQPAKGEILILKIENLHEEKIISHEIAIAPLGKDLYYIAATHDWNFHDSLPSEGGKTELLANLSAVLKLPFKVIEHKAAIRPTVKDRRPFIGFHPQFQNVGIFNGMGTKGFSLAPYFAKHFAENLLEGKELMREVNVVR